MRQGLIMYRGCCVSGCEVRTTLTGASFTGTDADAAGTARTSGGLAGIFTPKPPERVCSTGFALTCLTAAVLVPPPFPSSPFKHDSRGTYPSRFRGSPPVTCEIRGVRLPPAIRNAMHLKISSMDGTDELLPALKTPRIFRAMFPNALFFITFTSLIL